MRSSRGRRSRRAGPAVRRTSPDSRKRTVYQRPAEVHEDIGWSRAGPRPTRDAASGLSTVSDKKAGREESSEDDLPSRFTRLGVTADGVCIRRRLNRDPQVMSMGTTSGPSLEELQISKH